VPIAAWLGQHLGWRAAFVLVGAIAAIACMLIRRLVPDLPAAHGASPLRELGALARPQVWLTLGIGAIGFGGLFSVFSLRQTAAYRSDGHAGRCGAGRARPLRPGHGGRQRRWLALADKSLMRTIAGLLAWAALVLGAVTFTASHAVAISINVFLVGTIVAIGPALQIRLMDVAGDAQTLAAALNHSRFNVANALGAWLGGGRHHGRHGLDLHRLGGQLACHGGIAVFAASVWQGDSRARGQGSPEASQLQTAQLSAQPCGTTCYMYPSGPSGHSVRPPDLRGIAHDGPWYLRVIWRDDADGPRIFFPRLAPDGFKPQRQRARQRRRFSRACAKGLAPDSAINADANACRSIVGLHACAPFE
jgi:DHA1 family inner membrane transport protein